MQFNVKFFNKAQISQEEDYSVNNADFTMAEGRVSQFFSMSSRKKSFPNTF